MSGVIPERTFAMREAKRPPTRKRVDGKKLRLLYVLGFWPEDTITRATLRAFLPPGETVRVNAESIARQRERGRVNPTKSKNVVTHFFQRVLWEYEKDGLIAREGDRIRILDRDALRYRSRVLRNDSMAFLRDALTEAQATLEADATSADPGLLIEERRRELIILDQMMRSAPTGRGSVRLVPRGTTL